MPASPTDSHFSLSQDQSDKTLTAETALQTVMAEQISYDAVTNSESIGGPPLVDVAANQTNTASAELGTNDQPYLTTKSDILQTSQNANELATNANALTSETNFEYQATDYAADPSAGEAARAVAEDAISADRGFTDQVPLVNGMSSVDTLGDVIADHGSVPDGSLDASLNSDTEGSRGDVAEAPQDDKHHARSNSVKKPTTFSKVSATRNFLTKSASTTPTPAKAGDKPSPIGTPVVPAAAKPRLVAKTGTSLRDLQKTRIGTDGASGPDASKVWNKNRPTPLPPPKQFTDEELKQQYGIHLATRLQASETGKESKWADIDEEEDDWAPEAVEWMDGTKSTLAPQDPPPVQQKPTTPQPSKPTEVLKPTLALKRPTEPGVVKTILKPGAIAAALQAKQGGLESGTPLNKSTSKPKSPAPAPAKSPWAALPPVETMSPINPPVQQQQPLRFASQDARAYDKPPPSIPAREIAADTFDRSWREGEGVARELFNSANGRYEPAPEGRRSSIKPDSTSRKPAVLQRSSNGSGPAEPSAAFQSRTTSQGQMDGPFARRRGSSFSGSQGSIPPGRRMSMTRGPELSPAPERRTVVEHDMRASPVTAKSEVAQSVFAQQSAWQQQMPPQPEPGTPQEDPVEAQKRIMREKRETAQKRRQEQEAKEESEKQERLKAKLAALGGAGKSKKEREAEAAAAAAAAAVAKTPSTEPPSDIAVVSPPAVEEVRAQLTNPTEQAAGAVTVLEAQPMPPAPETAVTKPRSPEEVLPSPLPPKPTVAGLPERPISSADQSQRLPSRPHLSPRANARAPFQQQPNAYTPAASSYSSPRDRKQQPFGRSPLQDTGAFSPWPTSGSNGNVWGSSGIGNGTFESSNVFAPMPMSQQGSALPPPPGMTTRTSPSNMISPHSLAPGSRSPALQQQSVAEPPRGFAPPGLESRPESFANQTRVNGTSPVPGLARQPHAPGPIAPPSRTQQQQQQQSQRQDPLASWNQAAHKLPYQYRSDVHAAENKTKEAVPAQTRDDVFKETFKQTAPDQGRLGGPRRYDKTEYTIHDGQGSRSVQSLSPAPPSAQTQPSGPSPAPQDLRKLASENAVRIPDGSLNPAHGGQPAQQPPIGPPKQQQPAPITAPQTGVNYPPAPLEPHRRTRDALDVSPPPPETSSHPAFDGNAGHPLVRLPMKPRVRLPPPLSQMPPQQTPTMIPHKPVPNWGLQASARPIVMNEDWQARFNGLFNRTAVQTETPPSPPKTPPKMQGPASQVTASSRVLMDEPATQAATVSLPQAKKETSTEGFTIDGSHDVWSKSMIDQMFTEELSFGSSPRVFVPPNPSYDGNVGRPMARGRQQTGNVRLELVESRSRAGLYMEGIHPKHRDGYYVHLPEVKLKKLVKVKQGSHTPSAFGQERKASGKFNKTRGRDSMPASPAVSATPNGEVRKASTQTGAAQSANAAAATTSPASDGDKKWAKPPKGFPRRNRPTPVKST